MQEQRKSMGGALVDVFDAAVALAKTEVRGIAHQAGQVAKAKGLGVVLLLGATGPLILGLVFLILAVFYGLMRLGLGAWAAALIIALLSFVVMGALVMMGLRKLSAEVPRDDGGRPDPGRPMTEDERLEAEYQEQQRRKLSDVNYPAGTAAQTATQGSAATRTVGTETVIATPVVGRAGAAGTRPGEATLNPSRGSQLTGQVAEAPTGNSAPNTRTSPDTAANIDSLGPAHTGTRASAASVAMGADVERGTMRPGLSTSGFTAGGVGVNASDQGAGIKTTLTRQEGVSQGTELRGTDAGQVRLPVYEATETGEPQVYGSGLNKKIDGSETHDAGAGGHGGHTEHDPNLQHPVVLKDAPGIRVSTTPTFRDDMPKEDQ
ncbi:phage holin family protein [Deinococcus sp. MIMF12]|uniref:Phage holin family protein n=1 Tax=Deinococcus rhizophilus TaxID=3049544 RepID=A0ABT7JDS8_9DEIO|nr:phage holin family protein [Deinococcus rhizophilus]MDL2343206.1 phage holin family protein [Deinococcus rhizophilus]